MVRFWKLVVCKLPAAVRYAPPAAADNEAVGVPLPIILSTANLALVVDVPPKAKSMVVLIGTITLPSEDLVKSPNVVGSAQESEYGPVPETCKTFPAVAEAGQV